MTPLEVPASFRGFHGEPESELEIAYLLGVAQQYLPFPFVVTSINDAFPDCGESTPQTADA